MIGNRPTTTVLEAVFKYQHYFALINMIRLYPKFRENLWRYLTGKGAYPYDIQVRTPVGLVAIRLYSHHDLLTVNEIFCRQDYAARKSLSYVVDLGANIGISALYFLTRNANSQCILYEPDPRNIEKLKCNLKGLENRYTLIEAAVSDQTGQLEFGIEPSGRYGGIGLAMEQSITVNCMHINDVLRAALQQFPYIDILKIDTEGVEIQTVTAIGSELLECIRTLYLEAVPETDLYPHLFKNKQSCLVRKLSRHKA